MSSDRPSSILRRGGRTRPLSALSPLAALAAFLLGLPAGPAEAALVMQANNVTASAGGTGSFDLVLTNTVGGTSFSVSGFSAELSVAPGSGVRFTGVTVGTLAAPYIFTTLQSPPFSSATFPTTDFTASDASMTAPGFVTLAAGQTVGLEHVSFSVAGGTSGGPVPVTIVVGSRTQVLDVNVNLLPFTATNGTITVVASAVPEPSSIVSLAIAMTILPAALISRRSLRRGRAPEGAGSDSSRP